MLEETGYDIEEKGVDSASHFMQRNCAGKKVGLFIVVGVHETFPFAPRCKGEISEYSWFKVADLPRDKDTEKLHVRDDASRIHYFHVRFS